MKTLIAIVLALTALCAQAKDVLIAQTDAGVMYLTDQLCKEAKNRKDVYSARFVFHNGRTIKACYMKRGEVVLIQDEEGDSGSMPTSAFKPPKHV